MSDVYYNKVMHPLVSGYFETLTEVREVLEENGRELKDFSPEHKDWRLVEQAKRYLDAGDLADRFHRLRYLDEDEDGPAERWAFSYSTPNDVLFNGVLIRDLETGEWDENSPVVMTNRLHPEYWTSPELIELAEQVVENTRGSVNDQSEMTKQDRARVRAEVAAKEAAEQAEADAIARANAPRSLWQRLTAPLFGNR
ncbi:hypothetical protein EU244_027800 [Rhodococcus qingshengii]|uniref:hypothetical protein n=1 Tax=Rhodococcus qingshengii TaxID=334542 RepID=UPI0010A5EB07|nr:hypothetical protein [Rhodococcus qingshengii]THJ66323.1 hypothetical protein EU244_27830 [Rhodococcus qingshengii]